MLKVVKLLKLYVENFRGIKNFVLTPDGRSATVQGGNGTGKSTLMAAFLWLLTGKDAQGRENYNVFPLGTDGNRLSGCSPTVTATGCSGKAPETGRHAGPIRCNDLTAG